MLIADLLKEANNRRPSYKEVKRKLDTMIINKMGLPNEIKSDVKMRLKDTDDLHSDAIHDIMSAIQDDDENDAWNGVEEYIENVYYNIIDYYGNAMNFAPGYKVPKMPSEQFSPSPSDEDDLIKFMGF